MGGGCLEEGGQGPVYVERGRDDLRLLGDTVVEGVDVIQRRISVVDKTRAGRRRQKKRTYSEDGAFMGGASE